MIRICVALAVLLTAVADAIPCRLVRKAVERYGEAVVESWARSKGFSDKEIDLAKRCLR
jgi:hypothetical protein